MFRLILTGLIAVLSLPALAQDQATLTGPAETALISSEPANIVAFYRMSGDLMQVTLVFKEDDGETFRTRVSLHDDQTYQIVIGDPGDDDVEAVIVQVRRNGSVARIVAADPSPKPLVASN